MNHIGNFQKSKTAGWFEWYSLILSVYAVQSYTSWTVVILTSFTQIYLYPNSELVNSEERENFRNFNSLKALYILSVPSTNKSWWLKLMTFNHKIYHWLLNVATEPKALSRFGYNKLLYIVYKYVYIMYAYVYVYTYVYILYTYVYIVYIYVYILYTYVYIVYTYVYIVYKWKDTIKIWWISSIWYIFVRHYI